MGLDAEPRPRLGRRMQRRYGGSLRAGLEIQGGLSLRFVVDNGGGNQRGERDSRSGKQASVGEQAGDGGADGKAGRERQEEGGVLGRRAQEEGRHHHRDVQELLEFFFSRAVDITIEWII